MRLSAFALLFLAASAPALAVLPDTDGGRPARAREQRPENRAERSQPPRAERAEPRAERAERPQVRIERPDRPEPRIEARPERAERQERFGRRADTPAGERGEQLDRLSRPNVPEGPRPATSSTNADGVAGWRWRERDAQRRGRAREVPPAQPSPVLGEAVTNSRAPATTVRSGDRRIGEVLRNRIATEGWRREWRQDRRYDWRRHRDHDRSRFRLSLYIDPFGWRYRPWQIQTRLPYRYYSSQYWISDTDYFRLPPVYGPYRWVRYWNDALLIDLRSGRVVDVIPQFFW